MSGRAIPDFNPRSPCGERPRLGTAADLPIRISIHAPLAGSDRALRRKSSCNTLFQSTLPLRGATHPHHQILVQVLDFNPRSPCGERPKKTETLYIVEGISIHAPLAGSDQRAALCVPPLGRFQSTLPLRGATAASGPPYHRARHFNPRSPCGERRWHCL